MTDLEVEYAKLLKQEVVDEIQRLRYPENFVDASIPPILAFWENRTILETEFIENAEVFKNAFQFAQNKTKELWAVIYKQPKAHLTKYLWALASSEPLESFDKTIVNHLNEESKKITEKV